MADPVATGRRGDEQKGGEAPFPAFGHGGNLRQLAAAAGVRESELLDFSASINPLGPPRCARPAISAAVSGLVHYPDPDNTAFVDAICKAHGLSCGQVIVANGTTEIIFALFRALPVSRALIPAPSYIGYQEAAAAAKIPVVHLEPAGPDFALDDALLERAIAADDLVFLGHPNNPTGRLLDMESLSAWASAHRSSFFVVDEWFIDFVDGASSALSLLSLPNIIVLRSMTKFYALPGLRLGFAAASGETARAVRGQIPPWSVNSLAAAAAVEMLADTAYADKTREVVSRERRRLAALLEKLPGVAVWPAAANFLLLRVGPPLPAPERLFDALLARGILVRSCASFAGLGPDYLRVAVRGREENQILLDALAETARRLE